MLYPISKTSPLIKPLLIAGGLVTGTLTGFFGGGGGMLVVPLLTSVLTLEEKEAHATAIAVILPVSLVSATVYLLNGGFPLTFGFYTMFGVVFGGIIGALILKKIKNRVLTFVFYATMTAVGIRLVF